MSRNACHNSHSILLLASLLSACGAGSSLDCGDNCNVAVALAGQAVTVIDGNGLELHPQGYDRVVKGGETSPEAGFAMMFSQGSPVSLDDPVDAFGIGKLPLRWSDLEPSNNNYNWSAIDDAGSSSSNAFSISELRSAGKKGIFRIVWDAKGTSSDLEPDRSVPKWAVDRCNNANPDSVFASPPDGSNDSEWNLWNPCMRAHLIDFLEAFAARYGVGGTHDASDVVIAVQASANRHGEAVLRQDYWQANDPTYTEANYSAWCQGIIDTLAAGFGAGKVVSAWNKDGEPSDGYNDICRVYAIDTVGSGVRDGGMTDGFQQGVHPAKKRYTKVRKLTYEVDETGGTTGGHQIYMRGPNFANNRGHADMAEGEERVNSGFSDSVGDQVYPVYHSYAAKGLAMGLNLNNTDPRLTSATWWNDSRVTDFRKSAEWMRRNMGYPDADRPGGCGAAPNQCAPQAFSLLYVMGQATSRNCRDEAEAWHWEGHLWHRPVAGNGVSVPAKRFALPSRGLRGYCPEADQRYIYQAMATNGANNRLYFDLESSWNAPNRVDVLVTYFDENNGNARIRYCSTDGEQTSASWSYGNTGDLATAVIELADFDPTGCLAGGNDLAVQRVSGGELAVQMVRILRQDQDAGGPTCGDGQCGGGESCSSCATDCGACPPTAGDRIEAEDMTSSGGFRSESLGSASGGLVMNLKGGAQDGHTATLTTSSPFPDGLYDVVLGYHDEQDGQATITTSVAGQTVDSFVLDVPGLGTQPSANNFRTREAARAIAIRTGDSLEITAVQGQWDHASVDYIELVFVGSLCGDGVCSADEDCGTCEEDCGACGPVCGDAICEPEENCGTCEADCGSCGSSGERIEAEDMIASGGYRIEALSSASGGSVMNLKGGAQTGHTASLSVSFPFESGLYDIVLGYHDEQDGDSTLLTRVAGQTVDSFTLDVSGLGAQPSANNFLLRQVASGVAIYAGDALEIVGTQDSWDHANVDYIEVIFVGTLCGDGICGTNEDCGICAQDCGTCTPERVEAESMTASGGYRTEALSSASGGVVMNLKGGAQTGHTATLSIDFPYSSGRYDIVLGYHDEQDGDSVLTTRVGGQEVDSFVLDASGLGTQPNASNFLTRTVASGFAIASGETVEIVGLQESWDHANVDFVEFLYVGPLSP